MSISEGQLDGWRDGIGRTVVRRLRLDVEAARRFAVACGGGADVERQLPPLVHWAWSPLTPTDRDLDRDGHSRRGGFIPAIALPRRMFASATFQFEGSLSLDTEADFHSTIADVRVREGTAGELVLVDIDRRVEQDGKCKLREAQTIVYSGEAGPSPLPTPRYQKQIGVAEVWRPNEVHLFRFSAATFNSHRIHYDKPYATNEEGYPALVVHGPFTAVRLAALAARHGTLAALQLRLTAPLFANQDIHLVKRGTGEFEAIRCDGVTAASLVATYR